MRTITVTISHDCLLKLKELADRLNITPEELARVTIVEFLARPDDTFERAVYYVLNKNSDLYRRLI